jgi:hypothetical protein
MHSVVTQACMRGCGGEVVGTCQQGTVGRGREGCVCAPAAHCDPASFCSHLQAFSWVRGLLASVHVHVARRPAQFIRAIGRNRCCWGVLVRAFVPSSQRSTATTPAQPLTRAAQHITYQQHSTAYDPVPGVYHCSTGGISCTCVICSRTACCAACDTVMGCRTASVADDGVYVCECVSVSGEREGGVGSSPNRMPLQSTGLVEMAAQEALSALGCRHACQSLCLGGVWDHLQASAVAPRTDFACSHAWLACLPACLLEGVLLLLALVPWRLVDFFATQEGLAVPGIWRIYTQLVRCQLCGCHLPAVGAPGCRSHPCGLDRLGAVVTQTSHTDK